MEKVKKKKLIKYFIIVAVVIIALVCARYAFLAVRGDPAVNVSSYEELAKELKNTQFILPMEQLVQSESQIFVIHYGYNRDFPHEEGKRCYPMFGSRGVFAGKEKYVSLCENQAGVDDLIEARQLDELNLVKYKSEFVKTESIGNVDVKRSERGFEFLIGDISYSVKYENGKMLALTQDEIIEIFNRFYKIAEDIFHKANEKYSF